MINTLEELHAALRRAMDEVGESHSFADKLQADTAFAVGEALGHLAKASALVGRDVDDKRAVETHETLKATDAPS